MDKTLHNEPKDEVTYKDIAHDTFLAKWPAWLRWILFIPAALVLSLIVQTLFNTFLLSFSGIVDGSLVAGLIGLAETAILFGMSVFIGAYVAPRYQFIVAVILLVLATIIAAIIEFSSLFLLHINGTNLLYITIHVLAAVVASGCAVYAIYNGVKV